jgi:SAM-dependent methyltransferase
MAAMIPAPLQEVFREPLRDLGEDDARLRGILEPASERGARLTGVTSQFLDDAATYHQRYDDVPWFREVIEGALRDRVQGPVARIIDIGSGSGNSVIPLLDLYPRAIVVATDISAPLLAILRDFLEAKRPVDRARCMLVRMDVSRDHYRAGSCDLAVGASILHHMRAPEKTLRACAAALRPGATALFMEPFETGHGVLRLAYRAILAQAARQRARGPGLELLQRMIEDHEARLRDKSDPIFEALDDKWFFTRSWFEDATSDGEWEALRIESFTKRKTPMTDLARSELRLNGMDESALAPWAWEIMEAHDGAFSDDGRRDLLFEATVALRRSALPMRGRRRGWWWNPAQSGRGFFFDFDGNCARAVRCHYGEAGEARWSVAEGSALDLSGDTSTLGIELAGEMLPLEPLHGRFARDARTGWWVPRSAPGAPSIVVEFLGERAMGALLARDGWSLVVAQRRRANSFEGEWARFHNGQTDAGRYRPPDEPRVLGRAILEWPAEDTLVCVLPDGARIDYRRLGPDELAPRNQ